MSSIVNLLVKYIYLFFRWIVAPHYFLLFCIQVVVAAVWRIGGLIAVSCT